MERTVVEGPLAERSANEKTVIEGKVNTKWEVDLFVVKWSGLEACCKVHVQIICYFSISVV